LHQFSQDALTVQKEKRKEKRREEKRGEEKRREEKRLPLTPSPSYLPPSNPLSVPLSADLPAVTIGDLGCL